MTAAPACRHRRVRLDPIEEQRRCLDCGEWLGPPECAHGVALGDGCEECAATPAPLSGSVPPARRLTVDEAFRGIFGGLFSGKTEIQAPPPYESDFAPDECRWCGTEGLGAFCTPSCRDNWTRRFEQQRARGGTRR